MKPLPKNHPELDQAKDFARFARTQGAANYNKKIVETYLGEVQTNLDLVLEASPRVRGLRAEDMFLYVVASLGAVKLIKQEDVGHGYYCGNDLAPCDFIVIDNEDRKWAIDVKSESGSSFKISDGYLDKLQRYAHLVGAKLAFAIFWEDARLWTLNRASAFGRGESGKKKWSIDIEVANEFTWMSTVLGDAFLFTVPPLTIDVRFPRRDTPIKQTERAFQTLPMTHIELRANGSVLTEAEAAVAEQLMLHGTWHEHEETVVAPDDDGAVHLRFTYRPPPEQVLKKGEMAGIGIMSQMITNTYLRHANKLLHTISKDPILAPGYMYSFLPNDFAETFSSLKIIKLTLTPHGPPDGESRLR